MFPDVLLAADVYEPAKDMTIPALSEANIPVDIVFGKSWGSSEGMRWTTVPTEASPGVRVDRTLINHEAPFAVVRVCNTTRHPVYIKQYQPVSPLQNVSKTTDQGHSEPSPTDQHQIILDQLDPSVPKSTRTELQQLIQSYQDIFSHSEFDLGNTNIVQHEINTGENRPFRQQLRPKPRAHLPVIEQLVEDMQSQGIIEPCQSEWASNIVLVKKKDGNIRFCVDYRKLNDLTCKDAYPLPRIDACLDTLAGAAWYSTFDLRSGFHQVSIHPRDANKTTFTCHCGTFRFRRMPFDLTNAPATFQRLMDTVLSGLNFEICLVCLEDIIDFSHDLPSHLERLNKLFQKLREASLKLKHRSVASCKGQFHFCVILSAVTVSEPTLTKSLRSSIGPCQPTCERAVRS